jgi:hypothetical protein
MAISNQEASNLISEGQRIAAQFIQSLAALEGWRLGLRTRSIAESAATPRAVNVSNMLSTYLAGAPDPPWPGMTIQRLLQALDAIAALTTAIDAPGAFDATVDTPKANRLLLLMLARLAQE